MKLIYQIILRVSVALVILLTAWAAFFYFALQTEINDEVDDALENLLLARRELGEQGFVETAAFLLHVAFTGFAEHALDELLEGGLLEGFFDEVDGAALEAMDTSPWPVMKMMGSSALRARRCSCTSRPLMPGMRTSSTRTAMAFGSYLAMKLSPLS